MGLPVKLNYTWEQSQEAAKKEIERLETLFEAKLENRDDEFQFFSEWYHDEISLDRYNTHMNYLYAAHGLDFGAKTAPFKTYASAADEAWAKAYRARHPELADILDSPYVKDDMPGPADVEYRSVDSSRHDNALVDDMPLPDDIN